MPTPRTTRRSTRSKAPTEQNNSYINMEEKTTQHINAMKEALGGVDVDSIREMKGSFTAAIESMKKNFMATLQSAIKAVEEKVQNSRIEDEEKHRIEAETIKDKLIALELKSEKQASEIRSLRSKEVEERKKYEKLAKKLDEMEKLFADQRKEYDNGIERIRGLTTRQDNTDQFNRKNQVVFTGNAIANFLAEMSPTANLNSAAANLISTKFGITDEENNIDLSQYCFRQFGKELKSLIISLPTYDDCLKILYISRSKKLGDLFANEYLIKSRMKLLAQLRRKKRDTNSFHQVLVKRGNVYVRRNANSDLIKVNDISDLQ